MMLCCCVVLLNFMHIFIRSYVLLWCLTRMHDFIFCRTEPEKIHLMLSYGKKHKTPILAFLQWLPVCLTVEAHSAGFSAEVIPFKKQIKTWCVSPLFSSPRFSWFYVSVTYFVNVFERCKIKLLLLLPEETHTKTKCKNKIGRITATTDICDKCLRKINQHYQLGSLSVSKID